MSSIKTAAQYVRSKGGVVVAAAGNCGCFDSTAENPYMISVSATLDATDVLASWSSRGNYIDIAAPGNYIWTTTREGGYMRFYGTSFASPVVAGVVAVMMGANPDLAPAEIETLLLGNADDRGTAGWDTSYGYGRVNAARAVAAASEAGTTTTPTPTPTPPADSTNPVVTISNPANGATVSGLVTVSMSASDNVSVSRVELYVDGQLYATDNAAPFSAVWDTVKTTNGSHTLSAKVYDAVGNSGTSSVVTVSVSNVIQTTDAIAPTTEIQAAWRERKQLKVRVAAADNVGIVKVELYVDGRLQATSSTPTTFSVNMNKMSSGDHMLQSRAYDAAGNVGMSLSTASFTK